VADDAEKATEPAPEATPEIDWEVLGHTIIERHGDLLAALPD